MVLIVLDFQLTGPPAIWIINPIVDLRVSTQPAQSLSTKARISILPSKNLGLVYLIPRFGVPLTSS